MGGGGEMRTKEDILTEIYKRSITHIEGYESIKIGHGTMFAFKEVLEAMNTYSEEENESLLRIYESQNKDIINLMARLKSLNK